MLLAEADGVDGNALAADGGDGGEVDAAGVIGAVGEQHDGAQGQGRGFGENALQGISDAGSGRGGGEVVGIGDALGLFAELVEADLEAAGEGLE